MNAKRIKHRPARLRRTGPLHHFLILNSTFVFFLLVFLSFVFLLSFYIFALLFFCLFCLFAWRRDIGDFIYLQIAVKLFGIELLNCVLELSPKSLNCPLNPWIVPKICCRFPDWASHRVNSANPTLDLSNIQYSCSRKLSFAFVYVKPCIGNVLHNFNIVGENTLLDAHECNFFEWFWLI